MNSPDPTIPGPGSMPLVSHFGLYALGTGVVAVAGLIVVPVYARTMGPSAYGTYEAIATLVQLVTGVLVLGLDSALAMTMHREGANRSRLIASALATAGTAGLAAALLFALLAPVLATALFGDPGATISLVVAAGAIAPGVVYVVASAALRNTLAPSAFVQAAFAYSATLAGVGGTAVVLGAGPTGAALGLACAALVGAVFAVAGLRARFELRSVSREHIRSLVFIGLPIVPAALFAWVISASDRLILVALTDTAQVGLYAAAAKLALGGTLLVSSLMLAWTPFALAIQRRPSAAESYASALLAYVGVAGALLVTAAPFARPTLSLVAGSAYEGGSNVVWLLLAGSLAYGAYLMVIIGVQLGGRPWIVSVTTGLAAALNIVGNLILIPRLGFYGAGVATLVAYLVSVAALFVAAQRVHRLPYPTFRIVTIAGAALAATAVTQHHILPPAVSAVLVIGVAGTSGAIGFRAALDVRRHLGGDTMPPFEP